MHAAVARSTFASQKVSKHVGFGALVEVAISKKCTLLWREAHSEVKMLPWREAHSEVKMHKTHHFRTSLGSGDVKKVHAVVARSTFGSENVKNCGFELILMCKMSFC